jgi:integrase
LNLTAKNPTVAQFLDMWLEEVVKPSVKGRTHEGYADVVRLYILPHIGAQRLDKLTVASVQRMCNDLQKRVSVETVHNAYRRLRTALNVAVDRRLIGHNVATAVRLPKIPYTEQRALTVDEACQLLTAVEAHRIATLYHVTLMLGLRKGEVSGLQWTDLNRDKAELKISQQVQVVNGKTVFTTPKSDTSRRTLPIPPLLLKRLKKHCDNQQEERALLGTEWKEHGLIFPTEVGTPIAPRNLSRYFYQALDKAGLDEVRFHDLRHTAATFLGELGVSESVIGTILGHSGGSVTRKYVHATKTVMRTAVEQLEQLLNDNLAIDEQNADD